MKLQINEQGDTFDLSWDALSSSVEAQLKAFIEISEALATARTAHSRAAAAYREWKARAYQDCLAMDQKMPEWKARAIAEASPGYMQHRTRISALDGTVSLLSAAASVYSAVIGVAPTPSVLIGDVDED